jgi:hypothetical protein
MNLEKGVQPMNRFVTTGNKPGTLLRMTVAAAALVALTTTACSSDGPAKTEKAAAGTASALHVVSAASLSPGDAVAAPTGEPVLRLFGKIATTNGSDGLTLDMATIERLGKVSFEVYEPYEKKRMTFQGVSLAKVLALAGVGPEAQQIHMVALDDYATDLSAAAARTEGLMLATHSGDGSPLQVEHGGPARLVFLDGTPGAEHSDLWIWSMATMEVK